MLTFSNAALGFSGLTSNLKRHGSETEVNRAGVDFERLPLFHTQQRRASPQRRFHPAGAAPTTHNGGASISKSVTLSSAAANNLQNHPTISSTTRDYRGHGSLGRGGSLKEDA